MSTPITVETVVNAPIQKVWDCYTKPEHIVGWAFASEEWEALQAENDVTVGGRFKTVMSAKDGSASFDFTGTYTAVTLNKTLDYTADDGRHVRVSFADTPEGVRVTVSFEPESENPEEMQRGGWQSILDNFKKYTENNK